MAILSNQRLTLSKIPMESSAKPQGWMTLAMRDSLAVHGLEKPAETKTGDGHGNIPMFTMTLGMGSKNL